MHYLFKAALAATALFPILASAALTQDKETVFTEGVDISDNIEKEADLFVDGTSVLDDPVCVGNDCDEDEVFPADTLLLLKENRTHIVFDDTTIASSGQPRRDWKLLVNDPETPGIERFSVMDVTKGTVPFTIAADVPDNAFWINEGDGYIGLGTSLPTRNLHIVESRNVGIKLDSLGSLGAAHATWDLIGDSNAFFIVSRTFDPFVSTVPIHVATGAPDNTLTLDETGNVGLGTRTPAAPLEISDDNTFSFFRISATGAPSTQSVDIVFTQGPLDTGELRYNLVDGDGPEMRLDADGNMLIDGALTQNSDKYAKTALKPIDPGEILEKVAALPVSEWSYIDGDGVRHIGPMAQDFHALFGTGASATGISTLDTSGVALAAIQALREENAALKLRDKELTEQNSALRARDVILAKQNDALLARIEALEAAMAAR